jgi:dihydropteroate synthase
LFFTFYAPDWEALMRAWADPSSVRFDLPSPDRAGIDLARIVFDPGVGFGKNALQSLRLLRNVQHLQRFGLRLLVGHSRKSFMQDVAAADRADRDLFTIGASLNLCRAGVDILRVHNVAAHAAAYRGWAHVEPLR